MRYTDLTRLHEATFKRIVGIPRSLFQSLVAVLEVAERCKLKSGCPTKLSTADQLLLTLNYWREYRTYAHLGMDYGIHESTAQRTVKRIEARLAASDYLALTHTALQERPVAVIVDASETPIERPKKNRMSFTAERNIPTP